MWTQLRTATEKKKMLRFLSGRRGKGNKNEVGGQKQGAQGGGSQFHPQKSVKPYKNCILCKVIVLDGTDLSIELPVSHHQI